METFLNSADQARTALVAPAVAAVSISSIPKGAGGAGDTQWGFSVLRDRCVPKTRRPEETLRLHWKTLGCRNHRSSVKSNAAASMYQCTTGRGDGRHLLFCDKICESL